jgi:hypothetical protein
MFRCATIALAALAISTAAAAQVQRAFPQDALRASIVLDNPPEITLNARPARLGAGARVRGPDNLLKMPTTLAGMKFLVHYTVDPQGLVKDVWILTPDEAAKRPWPATTEEAQRWQFDPVAQVWTKP